MKVEFVGKPQPGAFYSKDILALIARYGVDAGVGYAVRNIVVKLSCSFNG